MIKSAIPIIFHNYLTLVRYVFLGMMLLLFLPETIQAQSNCPENTLYTCRGAGMDNSAVRYVVSGRPGPYIIRWRVEGTTTDLGNVTLPNDVDSTSITGLDGMTDYVFFIEDAMGNVDCQDTVRFANVGELGLATTIQDNPSCNGDSDGRASANIFIGGNPVSASDAFSYQWSNGEITQQAENLQAGVANVVATSFIGCTAEAMFMMTEPTAITINTNITPPACNGTDEAELFLNISGGSPSSGAFPYTIQWSTGAGDLGENPLTNLIAGEYISTVTDTRGCSLIVNHTIIDPPAVEVNFAAAADPSTCSRGLCNGMAEAIGSAGTFPPSGYAYTWESGETTALASMLCSGWNTVSVVNNGCPPVIDSIFVGAQNDVTLSVIDSTAASCFRSSDGSISLQANGGSPSYTYDWNDGANLGAFRNNLPAGTYSVTATDFNGCTSLERLLSVSEPDSMVVVVDIGSTLDPRCSDTDNGLISVRWIQGGNMNAGAETYTWSGNVPNAPNDNVVTDLPAGTYSVTVTDSRGCTDVAEHTLVAPPPLQGVLIPPIEPDCFGELAIINVQGATGGTGNTFTYSVDNGPQVIPMTPSEVLAGQHIVSVFDRNACRWDTTFIIDQPDEVTVNLVDEVNVNLGDSIQLQPNIPGSIVINDIIWTPPGDLQCTDCLEPWITPSQSATYMLTVMDVNGCEGSDMVFVNLNRRRNVFIPNAFSPNGDGINDFFQLSTGQGVAEVNSFRIYDRWGTLLYIKENFLPNNVDDGWDGRFRGRSLSMNTYVYVAEVTFIDNETLVFKGGLNLVR